MRRNLRSVLGSVAWMTAGTYVNSLLGIARGLVFANILGPQAYGVWGFLQTVGSLAGTAELGVGLVVARDMPGLLARGEQEEADALARVVRVWTPSSMAAAGVVLVLAWPLFDWPSASGWSALVPVFFAAMAAFGAAQTVARGRMAFRWLAVYTVAAGAAGFVLGWLASALFGVSGLVVSQTTVYGGAGVIAVVLARGSAVPGHALRLWKAAIREGWRLLLPNLAMTWFLSVDMLVAAWALPTASVGLYSVALLGSTMVANVIAGSLAIVVGQYLVRETSLSGSRIPRTVLVWGPAAALAVVLAPACAFAALLVPTILRSLLPEYVGAIAPAVVLLAAAYYYQSQFGFSSTFVASGRPMATVPVYAVLTGLNVAIDVVLLKLGYALLGIAIGSLIVNVCFQIAHSTLVGAMICGGRWQVLQVMLTTLAGGLPLAAVLMVLDEGGLARAIAIVGAAGWIGLVALTARWLRPKEPASG
jgi:O-antigen/teichoic acid export membrane protein